MKNILLIGGGSGLGKEIFKNLTELDNIVIVAGQSKPPNIKQEHFFKIDATNVDWTEIFDIITNKLNYQIDIVIFNSGKGVFGKTEEIPDQFSRQTFELNFWACVNISIFMAKYWSKNEIQGKFFLISSIAALRPVPFEAYYSASKTAITRFLENLQFEYNENKIDFHSIFLGLLKTDFRKNNKWFGINPSFVDEGANITQVSKEIIKLLYGKRKRKIIGWRERIIILIDRIFPNLYNNVVLKKRIKRIL